jgi:hypothetical protein|tara:strand:- start:414 stop:800 length:387 start_codon:yes stop_codon:yes gene_type:complete
VIYLATPYSHPTSYIRTLRYHAVTRAAVYLMKQGYYVFSPITQGHPMQMNGLVEWGYEEWLEYDFEFFNNCSQLNVLMLPGWDQSPGVDMELAWADKRGIGVEMLKPEEVGVDEWIVKGLKEYGVVEE